MFFELLNKKPIKKLQSMKNFSNFEMKIQISTKF